MALALVGGAAIGALFGVLYDVVKEAMGRTVMQFKPLLSDLKFTLDCLRPRIIQQIGDRNMELGLPNDEIESLQRQMEEGAKLVAELSKLRMWNCYVWCSCCNCIKPSCIDQLVELDRSLRALLEILKLQEANDMKENLILNRKIYERQYELARRQSEILQIAGDIQRVQQEAKDVPEPSGSKTETVVHKQIEGHSVQDVFVSGAAQREVCYAPLDGGGATLGAVFAVLFSAVIQVKDKTRMFKRSLGYLKSTLDCLKPLIEEIAEYNKVLQLPEQELENFRIQMMKGVEIIHKCSKVCQWASYKKYEYTSKLLQLDESLQRLLNMLRAQLARNAREGLVLLSNIERVLKRIEGSDMVQNHEPPSATVGLDVMNLQGTEDVIKETFVAARKIEEGVKQIEVSGAVENQIKNKSSYEVVEPALRPVGLNVANVHGTRDAEETLDSAANMEAGVKQTEESDLVQNQIEIPVVDPSLSTVELDVMNMQGTRDVKESLYSAINLGADTKQIEGSGVAQNQIETSVADTSLPTVVDVMNMQGTRNMETLDSTVNMEAKIEKIEESGVQNQIEISVEEPSFPTVGLDVMNMQETRDENTTLVSLRDAADKQIEGIGMVKLKALDAECELPLPTVGLDVPLTELRIKLIKDDMPALVITGPEGCGKTTLAKMFCQDEEVRRKFKSNIFFIPVSKEPNLDVVDRMQEFLEETGQHPSLLVLDDVWPGSESLLDKFDEFKTSNHKILVTSRSELPRFGSPYYLKSLNDEGISFDASPTTRPRSETSSSNVEDTSTTPSGIISFSRQMKDLASKDKVGTNFSMKKVVLRVTADAKTMNKAMKIAGTLDGVTSISVDVMNGKLTVVGWIETVQLVWKLRKICHVEILSVGPEKEEKKEEKEEKKIEPVKELIEEYDILAGISRTRHATS